MASEQARKSREPLDELRRVPFFFHLPASLTSQLVGKVELLDLARRAVVYLPGDPGDTLFIVRAGRVKLSKVTGDGKELTLAYRGPGDLFGEQALFEGQPREEMAEAVDSVRLLSLDRASFERLLEQHQGMAMAMLALMLDRRREQERRLEQLVFRDVTSKLAEQLLQLADEAGIEHPQGVLLGVKMTHRELANLIGATRETVSLTLAQLRQRGLLVSEGRRVILTDRDGLRALV